MIIFKSTILILGFRDRVKGKRSDGAKGQRSERDLMFVKKA
jgi:hypothetical protein